MLLAAEIPVRVRMTKQVYCTKLHHQSSNCCIFRCNYPELLAGER
jgi:hypothetical protein